MKREEIELLAKNFKGHLLHVELGKFYHRQGRYNLAMEELRRALELNPDDGLAHFEMGNVYVKVKDDFQAEGAYRKALELNPQLSDASLELGKIYRRQGRIDLATAEFRKVLAVCPKNWDALYELGRIYKEGGDYESAARVLSQASELKPDSPQIHFELGKIYRDIEAPELAIKEFEKVLSIGDNSKDTFLINKVLNEIEITQKKLILESKVRAILAMVINRCNVRCIMCNIWRSPWQAPQKTMDEIVSLFPYIEDMVWEGGEVFLMKGFEDIIAEASRYPHLKQVIFTNGLLLNEKIVSKLMDIRGNVDIVFSIDAVTKEVYEHIREGGDFDRLIKNLIFFNQLKERRHCNINIYFNAVIMRSNYRQLERFVDFAKQYGFNAMTLTPIRGDFGRENIFDPGDSQALDYIRKVMPKIIQKAHEYGIRLHNWIPGAEAASCRSEEKGEACAKKAYERLICHAPWQRMVIDSEGQVRPFVFCLKGWIGNIGQSSLQELWNSEPMQGYRRRILNRDYKLCQPECISGQVAEKIRDIE
jgi:MoaA/NifB/PqqE/SkfB family radical SAM enzyme/Tfp pilus assembly protein PilF